MNGLPPAISQQILALTTEKRSPAYLVTGVDGNLLDWGGRLDVYGLTELKRGKSVGGQVFFLEGLLPLDSTALFLTCVKTDFGLAADIHIFRRDDRDWVLLLDAGPLEAQNTIAQQKANELTLLREKQSRVLAEYLGKEAASRLAEELLAFEEKGDRTPVTAFSLDLRGFTSYSATDAPEAVVAAYNFYLRTITQVIRDETGLVDKTAGSTLLALFGVTVSTGVPARQAVQAAQRVVRALREVNIARQSKRLPVFDVSIGIASGLAVLGILERGERKTLCAIGRPIDVAQRFRSEALSNEILIDRPTFEELDELQRQFIEVNPTEEGKAEPVWRYRWR